MLFGIIYLYFYVLQKSSANLRATPMHSDTSWGSMLPNTIGTQLLNKEYLNTKWPLWILADSVHKHDEADHMEPFSMLSSTLTTRSTRTNAQLLQRRFVNRSRLKWLKLHQNRSASLNIANSSNKQNDTDTVSYCATAASMPVFDSVPGADVERPQTVFVYNGSKGQLIMNTMLSTQRYPMQEPVPGQLLYPPTTPLFRSKPIVKWFRQAKTQQVSNLNLIPFYEHEVIATPLLLKPIADSSNDQINRMPSVIYEKHIKSNKQRVKKLNRKYKAYHSADEVQWLPNTTVLMNKLRPLRHELNPTNYARMFENHLIKNNNDNNNNSNDDNGNNNNNDDLAEYFNNSHINNKTENATISLTAGGIRNAKNHHNYYGQEYGVGEDQRQLNDTITVHSTMLPYRAQAIHGKFIINDFSNDDNVEGGDGIGIGIGTGEGGNRSGKPFDNNNEPPFRIIYLGNSDEQLEARSNTKTMNDLITTTAGADAADASPIATPGTTPMENILSDGVTKAKHAQTKAYYSFPVYTLNKLLRSDADATKPMSSSSSDHTNNMYTRVMTPATTAKATMNAAKKLTNKTINIMDRQNAKTWFILNSRYHGPYKSQNLKKYFKEYYTSKYVQSAESPKQLSEIYI